MEIQVVQKVMKMNDDLAIANRARFDASGVMVINIISAPGSGKTSLIEAALPLLADAGVRVGVLEGDPDTTLDAERIAVFGVPVVQIQTAGGCHLEANLVGHALDNFNLDAIDLLVIENVGNLVCPVEFDLGEHKRVAVVSMPEGADKPAKYPKLFRTTDLTVLNKIDLAPHVDFDQSRFEKYLQQLKPGVPLLKVSCKTGDGVDAWVGWLRSLVQTKSPA